MAAEKVPLTVAELRQKDHFILLTWTRQSDQGDKSLALSFEHKMIKTYIPQCRVYVVVGWASSLGHTRTD